MKAFFMFNRNGFNGNTRLLLHRLYYMAPANNGRHADPCQSASVDQEPDRT